MRSVTGTRRSRGRTALVGAVLALVLLTGCDWAQSGFGPAGTYFDPAEPALTATSVGTLAEQWSAPCVCTRHRPLIVGGTVYAIDGGTPGGPPFTLTLRAFAVSDGKLRWSTPLGQAAHIGFLGAVANGLVYLTVSPAAGTDQLLAVDATTGAVRWRRTPPTAGSGPVRLNMPTVDGSLVFVAATASDASTLAAYDPTGRRVWTVVPGGQVFEGSNVAVVPGRTVYVSSTIPTDSGGVVLLRGYAVADGAYVSSATVGGGLPVQSLAVAGGLVYGTFFTDFGRLGGSGTFAADPASGNIVWTGEMFTLAVTPAAVVSNDVRTGTLDARDPRTGALLWDTNQTDPSVAATDQLLFFSRGDVRRLSDGSFVGRVHAGDGTVLNLATPSGGRVFGVSDSRLYALATPSG